MFTGVPHTQIDEVWPHVEAMIEVACRTGNGRYAPEDILAAIKNRDMQAWIYLDAEIELVCITEIVNYPRRKYCRILIATGKNRKKWEHHIEDIEAWAKAQGCDGMETYARKGWWRVFYRPRGWNLTHFFIERDF